MSQSKLFSLGLDGKHPYNYEYIGNANLHEKEATNDRSSRCEVVNDNATSHLSHMVL